MKKNLWQISVKDKAFRIQYILLPYNNGQLDNIHLCIYTVTYTEKHSSCISNIKFAVVNTLKTQNLNIILFNNFCIFNHFNPLVLFTFATTGKKIISMIE